MKIVRTFLGLLFLTIVPLSVSKDVVVTTNNGQLKGRRVYTGQSEYLDTFFSIPYAKPPVGSQRFKAPQPADSWTGTRDALNFSSMCPQLPDGFTPLLLPTSEDCLFLNVYSPKPSTGETLMPVMVWIHGGAYLTGSGAFYNGSELASQGVVVVTINYRLGPLGFLSTQDASCPGNNGLLDQILALNWVKNNIASFHGDPNDVTIFGESAGSGSVSILRMSPLAQGLFNKAIMESGVSLCPWTVGQASDVVPPPQLAKNLATGVGCGDDVVLDSAALVNCLRSTPVDTILSVSQKMFLNANAVPVFRPSVETVIGVIPDEPMRLLLKGAGSNISSIRGVNTDEYSLFYLNSPLTDFTQTNLKAAIYGLAHMYFPNDATAVANRLMAEYFNFQQDTTPEQNRLASVQLMTDFNFIAPTLLELEYNVNAAGHAKQFLYEFTHRSPASILPSWTGVMHADEIPFVFGQPFSHDRFLDAIWHIDWTSQDEAVSQNMMTLWTNFAKYGNPTPQAVDGVTWTPFSMGSQSYLDIGSSLTMGSNLLANRIGFWVSLVDIHGSNLVG